jgi:hypothetical protein
MAGVTPAARNQTEGNEMSEIKWQAAGATAFILIICVSLGPLVAHVVWCINAAAHTGSAIALLIAGLALPPVGWVHGVSVLLGFGGWV